MSSFRRFYRPTIAARIQDTSTNSLIQEDIQGAYKKKIDPNYRDQEGRGSLHIALLHRPEDPSFVEHVVRVGRCDVNAPDKCGSRPVAYAARMGHVRSLRVLIMHGAELDHVDESGLSALMTAASTSQYECLELLLKAGATVNLSNDKGETALHYAVGSGCDKCVRSLLKYGCRINQQDVDGHTVFHLAARAGDNEMLTTLLTAHCHGKAQINLQDNHGRTAMHWAVESASLSCVQTLLNHSADSSVFDNNRNSALLLAIKNNRIDHVNELIQSSYRKTTYDGRSLLPLAALLGYNQIVQLLLDAKTDPNSSGHFDQTALVCAAFESHLDIVDILLKHGANPNLMTSTTALLAALSCVTEHNVLNRHVIVARLLSSGADTNVKFARAWHYNSILKSIACPLSIAFSSGYISLVRMLLLCGCRVSYDELLIWLNDDSTQDQFNRKEILQPIKDHLTQPIPLSNQIRLIVRKQLKRDIMDKIEQLPIPPGLKSFLRCDELYHITPVIASSLNARGSQRQTSFHPFRESENVGVADLTGSGLQALHHTLLYNTLLNSN